MGVQHRYNQTGTRFTETRMIHASVWVRVPGDVSFEPVRIDVLRVYANRERQDVLVTVEVYGCVTVQVEYYNEFVGGYRFRPTPLDVVLQVDVEINVSETDLLRVLNGSDVDVQAIGTLVSHHPQLSQLYVRSLVDPTTDSVIVSDKELEQMVADELEQLEYSVELSAPESGGER